MSRVFVSPLATPFHSLVSIFPIPSRYISIFRAPPPRYFSPSLRIVVGDHARHVDLGRFESLRQRLLRRRLAPA